MLDECVSKDHYLRVVCLISTWDSHLVSGPVLLVNQWLQLVLDHFLISFLPLRLLSGIGNILCRDYEQRAQWSAPKYRTIGPDRSNGPLVQTGLMIFLMVLDRSSYRTNW